MVETCRILPLCGSTSALSAQILWHSDQNGPSIESVVGFSYSVADTSCRILTTRGISLLKPLVCTYQGSLNDMIVRSFVRALVTVYPD